MTCFSVRVQYISYPTRWPTLTTTRHVWHHGIVCNKSSSINTTQSHLLYDYVTQHHSCLNNGKPFMTWRVHFKIVDYLHHDITSTDTRVKVTPTGKHLLVIFLHLHCSSCHHRHPLFDRIFVYIFLYLEWNRYPLLWRCHSGGQITLFWTIQS